MVLHLDGNAFNQAVIYHERVVLMDVMTHSCDTIFVKFDLPDAMGR